MNIPQEKLDTLVSKLKNLDGASAFDFFQTEFSLSPKDAMQFGQDLLDAGKITPIFPPSDSTKKMKPCFSASRLFEFVFPAANDEDVDEGRFLLNDAPNSAPEDKDNELSLYEIAAQLKSMISALFASFVSDFHVDYQGMKTSPEFREYCRWANKLKFASHIQNDNVAENKALYLNLYNALVMHGHVVLGNPETKEERESFFTKTAYVVGKSPRMMWTLDVIEHGFLRCNRPKPFAVLPVLSNPQDERLKCVLPEPLDPRIHFALNCGAKSCPPVRFYTSDRLDKQLDMAACNFCAQETNFLLETDSITLSMLFKWYGKDFASTEEEVCQRLMTEFLKMSTAVVPRTIRYFPYDWSENS